MSNSTVLTVRPSTNRRLRMPMAVAGAAVLGLSMLLSVGPVLGAANNGNDNGSNGNSSGGGTHGTSGNVKVHDAATDVETSGPDNEPHVCAFWLGFTLDAPYETGTWVVVSWAPTGDGSTVASGVYNTAGDGVDNSDEIELPAGHYRVAWEAAGATNSKKKTFWVDDTCSEESPVDETQPEDVTPPTDAPGSLDEEESPVDETQPEDVTPPTDAPGSPDEEESPADETQPADVTPPTDAPGSPDEEESQAEELVLADQGTAPQDEPPAEDTPATDEDAPATHEEDVALVEEPVTNDVTSPEDEVAPPADAPSDEEPTQAEDSGSTDPGSPQGQDELGNIGGPDGPTMPDTATPHTPTEGGQFACFALLLLIGAHAAIRRDRLVPPTRN